MLKAIEDPRPIKAISTHGQEGGLWRVGQCSCTKIVPYAELGLGSYLTWFAVYKGDEIDHRVNSLYVDCVWYAI